MSSLTSILGSDWNHDLILPRKGVGWAWGRVLGPEFRAKKITIADLGRPSSSPGRLVLAGRGCTSVGTSRENKICDRRYLSNLHKGIT